MRVPVVHLPSHHPTAKLTKAQHRMLVASGIIVCAVLQIYIPDATGVHVFSGTTINLVWLLIEPEA